MDKKTTEIKKNKWQGDLFDCFHSEHCMKGCFCPCLLVNKTQDYLDNPSAENLKVHGCGPWCLGFYCLNLCGGFGFFLSCYQRRKIRKKYEIDARPCSDFWHSFCCPCCSIIQQYKEVEMRHSAPVKQGYQRTENMRM